METPSVVKDKLFFPADVNIINNESNSSTIYNFFAKKYRWLMTLINYLLYSHLQEHLSLTVKIVFAEFGFPKKIVADAGMNFTSEMF